ncbi:MAG: PD40 domain-containing protein, partial [Planctomycetaceae bacterium]|nr:PD40 domain-containing protein [Planctomycetaceae bacterium]
MSAARLDIIGSEWSPDGRLIVFSLSDGQVWVYDIALEKVVKTFRATRPLIRLAFSPDGTRLLAALTEMIVIFDLEPITWDYTELNDERQKEMSVVFSPDGSRLMAGGSGGLNVWNAVTNEFVYYVLGGHRAPSYVAVHCTKK